MKIAFTGASGTGKTSLARLVSAHYQIPLNPVGARSVAKEMGFDNPYDVDKAGRRVEFQKKLIEAKWEWEKNHEHFVTDRTYFDNMAYCALHMAEHITEGMLSDAAVHMTVYDRCFFTEMSDFQKLDPAVNVQSQIYHSIYQHTLAMFNLVHGFQQNRVRGLGLQGRFEYVKHAINRAALFGEIRLPKQGLYDRYENFPCTDRCSLCGNPEHEHNVPELYCPVTTP